MHNYANLIFKKKILKISKAYSKSEFENTYIIVNHG